MCPHCSRATRPGAAVCATCGGWLARHLGVTATHRRGFKANAGWAVYGSPAAELALIATRLNSLRTHLATLQEQRAWAPYQAASAIYRQVQTRERHLETQFGERPTTPADRAAFLHWPRLG